MAENNINAIIDQEIKSERKNIFVSTAKYTSLLALACLLTKGVCDYTKPVVGVNIPKGYSITNVKEDIEGRVDTVWFNSNGNYSKKKLPNGDITYKGKFKVHTANILELGQTNNTYDSDGNITGVKNNYNIIPAEVTLTPNKN